MEKKIGKKSHSAEKKQKGGPPHSSGFVGYVLKITKPKRGSFGINWMRFPGIRLIS